MDFTCSSVICFEYCFPLNCFLSVLFLFLVISLYFLISLLTSFFPFLKFFLWCFWWNPGLRVSLAGTLPLSHTFSSFFDLELFANMLSNLTHMEFPYSFLLVIFMFLLVHVGIHNDYIPFRE